MRFPKPLAPRSQNYRFESLSYATPRSLLSIRPVSSEAPLEVKLQPLNQLVRGARHIARPRLHSYVVCAGTDHAGAAANSFRMHGPVRGTSVPDIPGDPGNEAAGHGVGGREHRQAAAQAGPGGLAFLRGGAVVHRDTFRPSAKKLGKWSRRWLSEVSIPTASRRAELRSRGGVSREIPELDGAEYRLKFAIKSIDWETCRRSFGGIWSYLSRYFQARRIRRPRCLSLSPNPRTRLMNFSRAREDNYMYTQVLAQYCCAVLSERISRQRRIGARFFLIERLVPSRTTRAIIVHRLGNW